MTPTDQFARQQPLPPDRMLALVTALLALITFGSLVTLFTSNPRRPATGNTLKNPAGMIDRLVMFDTADGFGAGTYDRVELLDASPPRVHLRDGFDKRFPRVGTWTSPELTADFPFTELLPSWNVQTPPETGVEVELRTRDRRRGEWSPWLYCGSWGKVAPAAQRTISFRRGIVNVDNLVLDRPADAIQVRIKLESFTIDPTASPTLRRISLCYSGVVRSASERNKLSPPLHIEQPWARDIPVPFRTQKDAPPALSPEICSPTSVSMVMSYWGVDRPTVENALSMYDAEHRMFGNWNRAIARAGEFDLDAWLDRFRDWGHVRAQIAQGRPVIASIAFKKGQFPSSVLSATGGHLIVIRGFTASGDVIVNDPANATRGNGAIYKADELARAWFDHGGVGYVISGKPPSVSSR